MPLPGSAGQQICTAQHFVDALRVVVDHHRELIGGRFVALGDQEIAHVACDVPGADASHAVFDADAAFWYEQTRACSAARLPLRLCERSVTPAAGARIAWLGGIFVRCA